MRGNNGIVSVLTAALLMSVVPCANAFYVTHVTEEPKAPSFDLIGSEYIVTQVGISDKDKLEKHFSYGDNIPLQTAMQMILPEGWSFKIEGDVNNSKPISWPRSNKWLNSLEKAGRASDVRFLVDWSTRKVFVGKAGKTSKWNEIAKAHQDELPGKNSGYQKIEAPVKKARAFKGLDVFANQVAIAFDGKPENVKYFNIEDPARLVVDVYGVSMEKGAYPYSYDVNKYIDGVSQVRLGIHKDKLRFVFDLDEELMPNIVISYPDNRTLDVVFNTKAYEIAQQEETEISERSNVTAHQAPVVLKKGLLRDSLTEFAQLHGYTLAWELDPNRMYYIQFPLSIDAQWTMQKQMEKIQKAVNQRGNRIKLVAWKDNKVLQVCYY